MAVNGAQERITREVLAWSGMTVADHRFGGVEYLYNGRREIGHIHGDRLVDIPFPKAVRNEIVGAGLAQPHHLLADSGWVSFTIREDKDVDEALALLKRSYDIAARQRFRSSE